MRAYDAHGNPTTFEVGDFVDKHQEMMLEDLKELRDSIDENAEIKASFFDLEQDLSEFEDDEEKVNKYSHEFENPYSDDLGDSMDEDIGSRNDFLSNQILEINGERINGQAPNLGLIIEIKDGKPYIKDYVRRPISWDKDDEENQE